MESFNGKLRDGLLDREIFHTLLQSCVSLEACPRVGTVAQTSRGRALERIDGGVLLGRVRRLRTPKPATGPLYVRESYASEREYTPV